MAVTYAWRLDSDKYAYILPPYPLESDDTISSIYGFLAKSPLTDYALRNVAEAAETRFGKDSEGGLSEYTDAFMMMVSKINEASTGEYRQKLTGGTEEIFSGWTNMQYADLLSADVYYDVDSSDCADLRGVGIKGTRYLGSFPSLRDGVDLTNLTFDSSLNAGMEGYTDVYGIYLTDNLNNNESVDNTTNTPEFMFVIRNGDKGDKGDTGPAIDISDSATTGYLVTKDEFVRLEQKVSTYSDQIEQLNENVQRLIEYYNTLSLDNINTLAVTVSRLMEQMSSLQEYVTNINVTINGTYDDGGEGGGTSIQAIPLGIVKDEDGDVVHNDYTFTGNTALDGNIDEAWSDELSKIKSKKFHLLGYLEDDEKYLISDGGYRNTITMDKLYILPNIGVSLTGITFGVEQPMHVEIAGDTTMQNLSATNAGFQNKVYSENGFYQTEYDGPFTKVDGLTTDDFKEPTI